MDKMKMSPEALAAAREYKREWRRKNPERVREHNVRYWEKRAAKMATESAEGKL